MDAKESCDKERAKVDELERELNSKSQRLLKLQESLTESAEENTRLSRSIESDRMVTANLRRSSKDIEKTWKSDQIKFEAFSQSKKLEIEEKNLLIDEHREEIKQAKMLLSLKIMSFTSRNVERRHLSKAFRTLKRNFHENQLRTIRMEADSICEKVKGEYMSAIANLSKAEEKAGMSEREKVALSERCKVLGGTIDELQLQLASLLKEKEAAQSEREDRERKKVQNSDVITQTSPKSTSIGAAQTSPKFTSIGTAQTSPKMGSKGAGLAENFGEAATEGIEPRSSDKVGDEEDAYNDSDEFESDEGGTGSREEQGADLLIGENAAKETGALPTPTTILATSEAISSTIISLRSTLSEQEIEMKNMKTQIEALRVEKNVAIEQAGVAKLEALELAAKVEVGRTVKEMDSEVESSFSHDAKTSLREVKERDGGMARTVFKQLRAREGSLTSELPASARNCGVAESIGQKTSLLASRLYEVYGGLKGSLSPTTGVVDYARRGALNGAEDDGYYGGEESSPESKILGGRDEFEEMEQVNADENAATAGSSSSSKVRFDTPVLLGAKGVNRSPAHAFAMGDFPGEEEEEEEAAVNDNANLDARDDNFFYPNSSNGGPSMQAKNTYPRYSELGQDNLPRLMMDLRTRVAQEVYNVGESLFAVVDSDFRESVPGGMNRNKWPVTEIERREFKKVIVKATRGTLRWLLLIYLRSYDSLNDMVEGRKNEQKGNDNESPLRWSGSQQHAINECAMEDVDKVVKDRVMGLMEDVKLVWENERRLNRDGGEGSQHGSHRGQREVHAKSEFRIPFHRTERRRLIHSGMGKQEDFWGRESERRNKLNFLDSGAGPREFWATVSPSVSCLDGEEDSELVNEEQVEQHMWRLVLLVRCQDRERGLRLKRNESQRKLLDMRLYGLILCVMRAAFLRDNVVGVERTKGGGRLKLKFMDLGKWTGSSAKTTRAPVGVMASMGGIKGYGGGLFKRDRSSEYRYFEKIANEFEGFRRSRRKSQGGGGKGGRGKNSSSKGSKMRKEIDGGVGKGGMTFPGGHTKALMGLAGRAATSSGGGDYGILEKWSDRSEVF